MNFIRTFIFASLMTVVLTISFGQTAGFKKYTYKNPYDSLRFSFVIPDTWNISQDKDGTGFMSTCRPTTKEELDIYNYCWEGIIFRLQYFSGNLDYALKEEGNYTKVGENYFTTDRVSDSVPTRKLTGINWTGLYHSNTCGITCTDNGFHAVAGVCEFIYFSDGQQTICISTNGRAFQDDVLKTIISTFTFGL